MQTNWIATTEALPKDDEAVRFLTERHSIWMAGKYRCGYFESHWGTYDAGTVSCWHALEQSNPALTRQAKLA